MRQIYLVLIVMILLPGCMDNDDNEASPEIETDTEEKEVEKQTSSNDDDSSFKDLVETMSLQEKVSQLMYIGVQGASLSEHERKMIQEEHIGGIFLLEENIENSQQLRQFTSDIAEADQNDDVPLFMGVDEEGGRVSRIPDSVENFPSNASIGKAGNTELSEDIGELLAKKVKAFGFNMDFAPVLDVNNNPDNPVIGDRSFGADPDVVAGLGTATMQGISRQNIVPVIKHFPGHGDTSMDSHINLPKVDKSLAEMEEVELVPFQNAVNEGADMVMIAHVLYSEIDDQYPSSLSEKVITGLLREKLDFDGVVITDDMTMGAITENYGMTEAAVLSIQAGTDMLMMNNALNGNYGKVKTAILEAVEGGEISENTIDESVERILRLKADYDLENKGPADVEVEELNQDIAEAINRLR